MPVCGTYCLSEPLKPRLFCGIEPGTPVVDAEAICNTPFYNLYTGRNRIQDHLFPASTAAAISPGRD